MTLKNIELEEAIEIILDSVEPIYETEKINLKQGIGRILAKDYFAKMDNPPFDRSPLDGFALRSIDTREAGEDNSIEFKVIDRVYAGEVSSLELKEKQCIRIMTGGKMPKGSDCVIRFEDVIEEEDRIRINNKLSRHENYVFKGEDIKKDQLLVEKNAKLNFVHLGVLGSMGEGSIEVLRKPRLGILGTGDELVSYDRKLPEGKIYDTNGTMLGGRMEELGYDYRIIETTEDKPKEVGEKILENIDDLDLIITTGGVSVGDKDIFHEVIELINGERKFWRVKVKPGTPVMYSLVKNKPVLSLSGNPFAALTNFELLARPLLSKLSQDKTIETKRVKGIMKNNFPKGSLRIRRYVRCLYEDGNIYLPMEGHSSGKILSMVGCNGLIDMKLGMKDLKIGDEVEVVLIY